MRIGWAPVAVVWFSGCLTLGPGGVSQVKAPRRKPDVQALAIPGAAPVTRTLASAEATTTITPRTDAPRVDALVAQASAQEPEGDAIGRLHAAAVAQYGAMDSLVARIRRRETRDGKAKPEELMLFKERKHPQSVHFKWIGPEASGREVLYVRGQYGDKLQIVTAKGDVPFTPAGTRMSLARDSLLVKAANPHHDVTDACVSRNLQELGELYQAARVEGSGVSARYLGSINRPEYPYPLEGIEIKLPPNRDPDMPRGGRRDVFYDTKTHLPVLYLSFDEQDRELNYNLYDRLQVGLKLDDDDFNPERIWGKSAGPGAPASKAKK